MREEMRMMVERLRAVIATLESLPPINKNAPPKNVRCGFPSSGGRVAEKRSGRAIP
jgi:hypothetical protein